MADDDVIIMSSHAVGFIYYNNKVGSGENLVLTREPSCQYDKWAILVTLMEGDTIRHVTRTHSIALGPILGFILRNESGVASAYIRGEHEWMRAGQGYSVDVLITVPVPMRVHIIGILDQCGIDW
eukprot:5076677-Ditylum_brightwellii.AAC.1